MQNEAIDFRQRFSEAKERHLLALDEIVSSLYQDRDEIEQQIIDAKNKNDPHLVEKLYRTKLKFTEEIKNTFVEKTNIIIIPMHSDITKIKELYENQHVFNDPFAGFHK